MKFNENNTFRKSILQIIIEEVIRAIFSIAVPLTVNYFNNKDRKAITDNDQTIEELKDDFKTDHDWK